MEESTKLDRQIGELERTRKEAAIWRTVSICAAIGMAVWSVTTIKSSASSLAEEGPQRDKFVAALGKKMQTSVVPQMQMLASESFAEIQPKVVAEFNGWNDRAPEVTTAAMSELETLQTTLPARGEQAISKSFLAMIDAKEAKLHEMFPNMTEAQVSNLVANFKQAGLNQAVAANDDLFKPHQDLLKKIISDMHTIHESEQIDPKDKAVTWDLALSVLDVLRSDLDAKKQDVLGLTAMNESKTR